MPRDASGTYTLPTAPFQPLTLAKSADVNSALSDIAAALTDSQSRASPTPAQGDLDMNGHNITNAGTVTATGDISTSAGNITSNHAVIGDHLFAFRTGSGYGGVIGSWDTSSGKGAGFQLNANVTPALMEFGPADPGAGTLAVVSMTLSAAGDLSMAGTLATAGSFALAGPADMQGQVAMHAGLNVGTTLAVGGSFALAGPADMQGLVAMHAGLRLNGISPYANNAAAVAAGHVTGDVYVNTTTNALMVVL